MSTFNRKKRSATTGVAAGIYRKNRVSPVRRLTVTGIMAAFSVILMLLEFPLPLVPSFLKFDFSELPALVSAFCFGPVEGVAVCLIKNLVKLMTTQTGGVGELANFCIGIFFVIPAGLVYRMKPSRKTALAGCISGTLLAALVSLPVNYYFVYPAYAKLLPLDTIISMYQAILPSVDGLLSCLLVFNVPFTLFKGLCNSVITFFVYKRISPILKGKTR